jgi:polyisoprenyl-teichoic acid--peptidoglycan teichoic acid transferase
MSMFFPPDSPDSGKAVEPQQRRRGRRWALRGLAILVALIAVVVAAGGIYVGSVSRSFTSNVQREPLLPATTAPTKPDATAKPAPNRPAAGETEALNYVLMGSDSRDLDNSGAGRSDVLMVLHLAADRQNAYVISFPRDLYVPIPGYGKNKINAAFAFGGPPLTVQTLEQMLDVRMDHVALIDFEGFIALTDQLGGVTVDNKHASSSRGYDFPAGKITISGDEALAFVRERYTLPQGDLDRAERQRQVVQAILAKGMSREVLANPVRFNSFVAGISRHLTIDDQLSDAEIRKTALSLRLTASDVHLLQSPITGFDTVDGMSIDVVDERRTKELARALRDDTMDKYLENYPAR